MIHTLETLRVDLVDVLGARGTCREPSAGGDHLDASNRCIIAWRPIEHLRNRFTSQFGYLYLLRRELRQPLLLRGGRRRLDAVRRRRTEIAGQIAIQLGGIAAASCSHFRRKQCRYDAILVGRPYGAVDAAKGSSCAFFAA